MDVGRRAKQFAPFAALRGLDETIRQQEIIYEPKRDLSEEKKNELDMKLRILAYGIFDNFPIDLIYCLLAVFLCHILFLSDFSFSRSKKIYLVKSFL